MMPLSYVIIAIIMLLSLIVQGHASFDAIRIFGVKPDLLFISILYFGYSFGSFCGETTGFIAGLFHDAVSNSPLGLLTLPKVIMGYVAGLVGRSFLRSNYMTVTLLVFCGSICKGLLTLFLSLLFGDASWADLIDVVLPESVYNAILAYPLFFIFDRLFESELAREN